MFTQRVIAYIDGFNLYYGLLDAGLRTSRWLDLRAMCQALLRHGQQLDLVRYFTTRVRGDRGAARRQALFLDALLARGGIEIDYGHFLSKTVACPSCGAAWKKNEEKKTDVNIAVRLLEDAHDDRFDSAIVISGDSDLSADCVSAIPFSRQTRNRGIPTRTQIKRTPTSGERRVRDLTQQNPIEPPAPKHHDTARRIHTSPRHVAAPACALKNISGQACRAAAPSTMSITTPSAR